MTRAIWYRGVPILLIGQEPMTETYEFHNVFISYAREDIEAAKRVYDELKATGVSVWIDDQDLLPGTDWALEIAKSIKRSRYFIAILSTHSVSKRGFFQTELKKALEIRDQFPEDEIFFLPVRINKCDIPERIANIHCVDLFPSYDEGLKKIFLALKVKSEQTTIFRRYPIRTVDTKLFNREYIANDFVDNGDGTITDRATGLMWQKGASRSPIRFYETKEYVLELNKKNFAEYSDWRLPTIDELWTLLEKDKQINSVFDRTIWGCWSADMYANFNQVLSSCYSFWYINFSGFIGNSDIGNDMYYMRCVRAIE